MISLVSWYKITFHILGNTIIEENSTWDNRAAEEKKLAGSEESKNGLGVSDDEGMCSCCSPVLKSNNALPPHPTKGERIKYALSCPPHGSVSS